jgi:Carboxypeptidase regulatory-like domain
LLPRNLSVQCLFLHSVFLAPSNPRKAHDDDQTTKVTIFAHVLDATGMVVPELRVTVVNETTGVKYKTKTNNDGVYMASNLPVGVYHVELFKRGFNIEYSSSILYVRLCPDKGPGDFSGDGHGIKGVQLNASKQSAWWEVLKSPKTWEAIVRILKTIWRSKGRWPYL